MFESVQNKKRNSRAKGKQNMKNIYNRLPSFSPDYCGASGVFYEMDGLTIMCDPGACTGTILAYDEPRLDLSRSLHSVQIGEKQAVFGIDRELLEKAGKVLEEHDRTCVVLLGTPIAATLAVDYKGLAGELSRKYGIPGFGITTSSIDTYDVGEQKSFDALAEYAAGTSVSDPMRKAESVHNAEHEISEPEFKVNVIGATPLNMWDVNKVNDAIDLLKECGASYVSVWGRNAGISEIGKSGDAGINIVVSASGLSAARKLRRKFGTPYIVGFPIGKMAEAAWRDTIPRFLSGSVGSSGDSFDFAPGEDIFNRSPRALIVGEQVSAGAIRDCLRNEFGYEEVQVASFFMMDAELMEPGDRHLNDEDDFVTMTTENGRYDLVICDPLMYPLISYRPSKTMPWPHIAVSGRIYTSRCANIFGAKGSKYIEEQIGR